MNVKTKSIIAHIITHLIIWMLTMIPIIMFSIVTPDVKIPIDWKYFVGAIGGLIIGWCYGRAMDKFLTDLIYDPINNFICEKIFKI